MPAAMKVSMILKLFINHYPYKTVPDDDGREGDGVSPDEGAESPLAKAGRIYAQK